METWLHFANVGDYDFNMALDEAMMIQAAGSGHPLLRFYGWKQKAASFGYFQKIAEIERATLLRPLVRRPTGGGLVPHAADWTYSLAVPPAHPWYELKAAQSYERVHLWIQAAFALLGVTTELAPGCRKELPGQCFAGYEQYDLLQGGRKIAGAAQRRCKAGLLIQGSIQPPPRGILREAWQSAMLQASSEKWGIGWREFQPDADLLDLTESLAQVKYRSEEHNRMR